MQLTQPLSISHTQQLPKTQQQLIYLVPRRTPPSHRILELENSVESTLIPMRDEMRDRQASDPTLELHPQPGVHIAPVWLVLKVELHARCGRWLHYPEVDIVASRLDERESRTRVPLVDADHELVAGVLDRQGFVASRTVHFKDTWRSDAADLDVDGRRVLD